MTLATAVYGDDLIPGRAESVFTDALTLKSAAEKLETARVFVRFRKLADEWTGSAGDSYREHLEGIETSLGFAIEAFEGASTALTDYGMTLMWAQTQAAGLISAYWEQTCVTPSPLMPDPNPYTFRAGAISDRALLRSDVQRAGNTAALALRAAVRDVPYDPTFWNRVGWGTSRFFGSQVDWVHGNGQFGDWAANGEGTALEKYSIVSTAMREQLSNPRQFAQDMVGWDTLTTDPVAWGGSGGLETLTGLGTGGSSMAISASRRAFLRAAAFEPPEFPVHSATDLATPTPGDSPQVFNLPKVRDASDPEVQMMKDWIDAGNAARLDGRLSPEGRHPTSGDFGEESRYFAAMSRQAHEEAGNPLQYVLSHKPDGTWMRDPISEVGDHTSLVNGSFAGQASAADLWHKPTIFQLRLADGSLYPEALD